MSAQTPIAIVGMGCRFPAAADGPENFWKLLKGGVDAMVEVPESRWDHRRFYDPDPERPGKIFVREGAFLREPIDQFDALAFGISPREAHYMDPQQRVLLEVTWEAFDDAGFPQQQMRGANVGVFVGGFTLDSMVTQLAFENQHIIGSHSGPGATMTMLANRVSHVFDLRGPSVSMDTACSSSLVATHFACQAIWREECDMALAGGVNIMLRPGFPIVMCKGGFLSHHGRCMAFDERAAGYARGEGAGVAVLKPLDKALEDGDRVYAVILATGINHDGHTQGISLPSRDAQAALVKRVLKRADVKPSEVRYIEAHGTGTQAGDPTEAGALDDVLREGRTPDQRAWLGSVKTNIGHLEAAAGIAGLLKAALVMHHGEVPQNLHFETPNPKIPFGDMCLEVPTASKKLDAADGTPIAGVNSFGYGGANAHVVMRQEAMNAAGGERTAREQPFLFPLSARDPGALSARATQLATLLKDDASVHLNDLGYTAALRSSHHNHRLALVADDRADLIAKLERHAAGTAQAGAVVGQEPAERPRLAFVYTGMGPQWWAMGRDLMDREPLFLEALQEVDAIFSELSGWSLIEKLRADEAESVITRTEVAQPANFAIQYALTKLWRSWGIDAEACVGHSVGEVAAAWASGALSLRDALTVSFHRSRLQQTTAGTGTMLAVGLSEDEAVGLTEIFAGVSVAAINSDGAVTLAGDEAELKQVAETLEAEGVFNRMLGVEVPYHSAGMDPIEAPLREALAKLEPQATSLDLYSTVTGDTMLGQELGASYWWRNVREPVRFAKAARKMMADGYTCFVEVGPHPVLRSYLREALRSERVEGQLWPSIRKGEPELVRMLESLGGLFTAGFAPSWKAVTPLAGGAMVRLPRYPFQRTRYWNESAQSLDRVEANERHPFLQTRVASAEPIWEAELSGQLLPWIEDHQIRGTVIVPGAAYVEAALAAGAAVAPGKHIILKDLDFSLMLSVGAKQVVDLQVSCDLQEGRFRIASGERGAGQWNTHARGYVVTDGREPEAPSFDLDAAKARLSGNSIETPQMYAALAARGLEYGPCFQTIKSIHPGDGEVLARIELPGGADDASGYVLHPALLDGAFQAIVALVGEDRDAAPLVPVGMDRVEVFARPEGRTWAHLSLIHHTAREVQANLTLVDDTGRVCATIPGLTLQPIPVADAGAGDGWTYTFVWQDKALAAKVEGAPNVCLVGATDEVAAAFQSQGATVTRKSLGDALVAGADHVVLVTPRETATPVEDLEKHGLAWLGAVRGSLAAEKSPSIAVVSALAHHGEPDMLGTPLWSAMRTVRSEHADARIKCVGLSAEGVQDWGPVAREVLGGDDDGEVRFIGDQRQVRRLAPWEGTTEEVDHEVETVHTNEQNVVLAIDQVGAVGTLHWQQIDRRAPVADEIEIRVEASGINFKDLLKFTGQLNPRVTRDTFLGDACGMECVGEVVRVGPEVKRFKVGDRVLAAPSEGSFQSFVTTEERTATAAPTKISPTDAAVLLPYLTAWHGLVNVARLQPGETVLLHSAAGGVGQCAVSIAKMIGARIIATAGSEEKRAFLRDQGIEWVSDSRSLQFVDDVNAWTEGEGVDVVLSALTTDGLLESVRLLKPCGRFIDIGKKAFIDNDALPLRIFNDGLTYASIDMDRMFLDRMPFCIDVVAKCVEALDAGKLQPLQTQVFAPDDAVGAFRTMAKGRHIGRIVIDLNDKRVPARKPAAPEAARVRKDGTYVVTGGLGGFGLEVARWLAGEGAGALLLLSRRGRKSPGAEEAIAALEARGVRVVAEAADVSDRAALQAALDAAKKAELPPVRGVFHAAMVLDDQMVADLTPEAWRRVLWPKAQGAWHLHELTEGEPIEHFVGFSSIAVSIGNPGQVSYVAANAFLDALAAHRKAAGKAGLSIQWGVLTEVGVVTRNRQVGDVLEASGMRGFSTSQALTGLGLALDADEAQLGVYDVDWERWTNKNPDVASQPLFTKVRAGARGASSPALKLARELLMVAPENRVGTLAERLRTQIAELLRVAPEQIGMKQSLLELGVDSLLALELVVGLEAHGFELNVVDLMQGPTVMSLAERQVASLGQKLHMHAEDLLASVDDMTEQEVEALVAYLQPEAADAAAQ